MGNSSTDRRSEWKFYKATFRFSLKWVRRVPVGHTTESESFKLDETKVSECKPHAFRANLPNAFLG